MQMIKYINKKYTKDLLREVRNLSKSYKCKVAALIVDNKGKVAGVGINHNGTLPIEKTPCCNIPVLMSMDKKDFCIYCYAPKKEFITYDTVVHAEIEALRMYEIFKNSVGIPAVAYITREPCFKCKQELKKYNIEYKVEELYD